MKSRVECLNEYGSDYMIQQKVNAGELFKVGKAVYSKEKDVPEIAVLAFRYPNAVITMNSAFYMTDLQMLSLTNMTLLLIATPQKIVISASNSTFLHQVFLNWERRQLITEVFLFASIAKREC